MTDDVNAFVPGGQFRVEPTASGPLDGLTFVAKDLFDVAGHVTGGGNPDWGDWHGVADKHAWTVQALLDSGARAPAPRTAARPIGKIRASAW